MIDVSPAFLAALGGSHRPVVQVDAWRDGVLMSGDTGLPITDGSLTISAGQTIRTRLQLTVADPDGVWTPDGDGALSPYGSELNVRMGVTTGSAAEVVSVAWCPIQVASTDEQWQVYRRAGGTQVTVVRGATTQVEATDRAQIVARAQFLAPTQPTQSTVLAEIAALLDGVVPWQAPAGVTDQAVPAGITYTDDRLAAVAALADILAMDVVVGGDGVCTLAGRATSAPVWSIPAGDGGLRMSMTRELSADGAYNAAIARGTAFDGGALVGTATIDAGPLAWDGPYGQVPYFYSSPVLGTQAQVDAAAVSQLARIQAERVQVLAVECVSNPALEVGDTVLLPTRRGEIAGRVVSATWPLRPGPMQLQVTVDPLVLAGVS